MYFRSDFQSLPFQAIECCLAHVKPINGKSVGFILVLNPVAILFLWISEMVSMRKRCRVQVHLMLTYRY